MALRLGSAVVDALLLGPEGRRRQLQDLPVLGDVWTEYAAGSPMPPDLLLLPAREKSAVDVARLLTGHAHNDDRNARAVAYLHDLVVASLAVDDLVEAVLPATMWWDQIERRWGVDGRPGKTELKRWIADELSRGLAGSSAGATPPPANPSVRPCVDTSDLQAARLGLILGLFLAAADHDDPGAAAASLREAVDRLGADAIVDRGVRAVDRMKSRYRRLRSEERLQDRDGAGTIFQITLNRPAEPAVAASVPAIKADAARQLFSISCAKITFAIIDSGIDHRHAAFRDQAEIKRREAADDAAEPPDTGWRPHRIKAAFDFTRVRAILGVRDADGIAAMTRELAEKKNLKLSAREIGPALEALVADGAAGRPVDWGKVRPLIELELGPAAEPETDLHPHGTHVAGILAADWQRGDDETIRGVCPDIALVDCRVLGSELGDSEFAVSAALQFIRFYNEQGGNRRINGVNMSLAIRHNVRNYACGRTPVCLQAEALVSNGVVVVAAAGNRGFQQYQLADSSTFEGYAASSITDPGNAEGVITVGSTHRHWPHTYGVSFFSSRGPTGDGRLKPDLLAPGEKIVSCIPGGRDDQMDGTSMAAPHVAGAAALLMARHEELKGQPAQVKQILCATATDLGRERSFQGHGMVDVLRAIQAV